MDDLDLYGDLGLSNHSRDQFHQQQGKDGAAAKSSAQMRSLEESSSWMHPGTNVGAMQGTIPPLHAPQQPAQPTNFMPGSVIGSAASVQPVAPGPLPVVSSVHTAVLAFQDAEVKELKGTVKRMQQEATESADRLAKQDEKVRLLESEHGVLVRNISSIYRTAVLELDRKNTEIKGLRLQLEQLEHKHHHHQQQHKLPSPLPISSPAQDRPIVLPPPPPLVSPVHLPGPPLLKEPVAGIAEATPNCCSRGQAEAPASSRGEGSRRRSDADTSRHKSGGGRDERERGRAASGDRVRGREQERDRRKDGGRVDRREEERRRDDGKTKKEQGISGRSREDHARTGRGSDRSVAKEEDERNYKRR